MLATIDQTTLLAANLSPPAALAPAVIVGRAFQRTWRAPSASTSVELRSAIEVFVNALRREQVALETIVVEFKTAIRRFGGMHGYPTLIAEEHSADGEECAAAYENAFACFVDVYFGTPPGR